MTAPATPPALRRRPRRRRRLATLLAALTAAVVLAGLLVLDQRRLRAEVAAVTTCRERAEQATVLADARLDRTATYLSPARVPDTALAEALLGRAAVTARGPVARAARRCAHTEVRPWHLTTSHRRDNVVAYLSARLASLDDIAADGTRYYDEQGADDELRRLRSRAFPEAP